MEKSGEEKGEERVGGVVRLLAALYEYKKEGGGHLESVPILMRITYFVQGAFVLGPKCASSSNW